MLSRRDLLIGIGAAGMAAAASACTRSASSAKPPAPAPPPAPGAEPGPLVLITLYGGNDGLNTVIPYADPAYLKARPTLGYPTGQALALGDGLGLNPKLPGLHTLWTSGRLAVVRGVGYPNPNLSHFESMDIWQTANPSDGTGPGWLGRWLDATGTDPMRAISVGVTLPPMLRGDRQSATAITGPQIELPGGADLGSAFSAIQAPGADRTGMLAAVASAGQSLLQVEAKLAALHPASADTGTGTGTGLAGQLAVVAALINAGAPTRVYQVSLASFDTHANEKANHERLLSELDQAVTGFFAAVHPPAVLMTFSEFGRRPAENASGGTDHGAAAPLFVAGHGVKGGFYGEEPSLTALDPYGNLAHNVDFRSVYATVLERVVGVDSVSVLGGRFPTLGFI